MELRKAAAADASDIMNIIRQAQDYLKEQGVNQWQNNYPNLETIENDIKNKNSYVLIDGNVILATVAVIFTEEKTYQKIYEGEWISDFEYAVIHRIAVARDNKGRRLALVILNSIEEMCINKGIQSIRVDTHEENVSMLKLLNNGGFLYCGVIYMEDGNKRLAFEKIL